jgi:hypothetical protein
MGVLSREAAAAATTSSNAAASAADAAEDRLADTFQVGHEPVMFCVHDAKLGEVAILHGTDEVVVKDPQLVGRILNAASRQKL